MSRTIRQAGVNARHLGGGFVRTANGEAWQYMVMPSQPSVSDAADWGERLKAARPLTIIMPRLADLTPSIPLANRRALKSFYRPIHILAMSTPVRFEPSPTLDGRNRRLLAMEHRGDVVHDRLTVIGVRLDAGGGKGRFLDRVVNLVVQAGDQAAYGEAPDDAFDTDRAVISEILRAGGCVPPTDAQMNRALAWWVTDRKPDPLEVMVERGHMHAFPDERTARLAEKLRDTRVDCTTWSKRIEIRGTWPMTVATLGALPFDGTSERDPRSAWAARLLASSDSGGQGAVAISVRGLVEPGEISRDQIDKDKDKVLEQAIKQATDGHKANEGIAEELLAASDVYQKDGRPWPTLVDGHVQVAIPGIVDRPSQVNYPGELNLNQDNQNTAWQDMQIGSEITYCPSPVYWPTPILAFAGLAGRSLAGEDMGEGRKSDLPGALLGFTEKDRQPVYCSPFASRYRHTPPAMLITGRTGSGKASTLDTKVPMPPQPRWPHGGVATIGDLQVGDLLYADDGKAYPISYLSPIRSDDLYEIEFSDGQRLKATGEHQWRVWDFTSRKGVRSDKHRASLDRQAAIRGAVEELDRLKADVGDATWTARECYGAVEPILQKAGIGMDCREQWVYGVMRYMELEPMRERRRVAGKRQGRAWPAGPLAEQVLDILEHPLKGGISPARAQRIALLRDAYESGLEGEIGLKELTDIMGGTKAARDMVKETLKRVTLKPSEADGENVILTSVWRAADMLEGIARRIIWRYDEDGTEHYDAQIATTREMLEAGLTVNNGHANWAIPRPKPVEGVHMDLPLDPWCLGAWLADGSKTDGSFFSDPTNGDLDHVRRHLEEAGFEVHDAAEAKRIRAIGLRPLLRRMGLYGDKHIPEEYFNASVEQRLELVRGLLDQDGTIDPRTHGIEFCQSLDHKPIVDGLVRLLRSLGVIVHEPSRSQAGYRDADGTYRRTQDRLRVTFTTDLPVFSLPRKKALLPRETRETANWLYVRSIRRVPDEPHRCLSIESPDHTYLVGGYIPTHNTRVLLHLAAQWGRLPNPDDRKSTIPIVFFDPKPNSSDFGPFVKSMGGMLVRLDSPEAEGILDPVRCIPWTMKDMIVQTAVEMLSQITGGRDADRSRDLALTSIIGYGLRHGADCTGEAVRIAYKAHQEGGEDADRIDPLVDEITPMLERQATNSSMFKLIYGTRHGGAAARRIRRPDPAERRNHEHHQREGGRLRPVRHPALGGAHGRVGRVRVHHRPQRRARRRRGVVASGRQVRRQRRQPHGASGPRPALHAGVRQPEGHRVRRGRPAGLHGPRHRHGHGLQGGVLRHGVADRADLPPVRTARGRRDGRAHEPRPDAGLGVERAGPAESVRAVRPGHGRAGARLHRLLHRPGQDGHPRRDPHQRQADLGRNRMDHIGRLGYALLAVEAVVGAGTWIPGIADAAVALSLAIPAAYLAVVAAALIGRRWYGRRATPPGRTSGSGRRSQA